jgi:hypothetical protein
MASSRRHTRSHPDPDQVPIYSDPENLVTWRNIRERQTSFFSGNPYLEISPSVVHQNVESVDLTDIPEDSLSAKISSRTINRSPKFSSRI